MRKKIIIGIAIWLVLIASFLVVFLCGFARTTQYETTDISDYGKYKGNYDNKAVESFVNSFFPERIEDYFENVDYSYKAQKGDTYAYEAYLEFTITDKEKYNEFIKDNTQEFKKQPFFYDAKYTEYVVSDEFQPLYSIDEMTEDISDSGVSISYAKIGKILCCEEEQKVIFVALGVYDGGLAKADYLNVYFNKFNINPREYIGNIDTEKVHKQELTDVSENIERLSEYKKINLDVLYHNAFNNAQSNVDKVNVNTKYAELWKDNIDYYYNEIIDYFEKSNDEQLLQDTKQTQLMWEQYCNQQVKYCNDMLISVYDSGTIVPLKQSRFEYEQYRERALVLYEQCLELSISVTAPGE